MNMILTWSMNQWINDQQMINKYDPYSLKDPYDDNMFRSLEIWWSNYQDMINKSGVIIDACWFWMILLGTSIFPSHPNMIHDQGIINEYDQYHPLSHPVEIIKYQLPLFWSVNKYHQLCRLPVGMFKDTLCKWIHQFLGTSRGVSVFVQTGVSIQWPCFVGKMNSKPFVVCVFPTCSDKPICVHIYIYWF